MSHIGILGLGNWGTALALRWLEDGHHVVGWTVEQEVYDTITESEINEKYLPNHPVLGLQPTMNLEECLEASEVLILALPSTVILDVVNQCIPHLKTRHVLVDLAKGLAPGDKLISEAIKEKLQQNNLGNGIAVLTGPTIAPEVAAGVLTTALVASEDMSVATRLSERLSTETFILKAGKDPEGAELWGAFKNTVALTCGLVDGVKNVSDLGGDNLKAALVATGFDEGRKLLKKMGASAETAWSPAGLGDLFVTVTSPSSRNRTLGEKLGSGLTLEEALEEMVMVAEGVPAARRFLDRANELGLETPFLFALNELLDGGLPVEDCFRRMVTGTTH